MDPIPLTFYALVCGALAFAGPWLGHPLVRIVAGAVVGMGASAVLPLLRGTLGY